jgi:hypothetical protein
MYTIARRNGGLLVFLGGRFSAIMSLKTLNVSGIVAANLLIYTAISVHVTEIRKSLYFNKKQK